MGIIICGIPKNSEGQYFCPNCGFTSPDIEKFAISMCWDCVFGPIGEYTMTGEDNKEEIGNMVNSEDTITGSFDVPGVADTKNVQLTELKRGDKVKFYLEDEVTSVSKHSGHARTKRGARVRMTRGEGYETVGSDAVLYKAELVERKPSEPVYWPPQPGEVWRESDGMEYHVLQQVGNGPAIYTEDNRFISREQLKKKPGIHRVYKKGTPAV